MHTSFLSRSVIAIASLAIGSAALAATPATAATASGITRDQVLKATDSYRTVQSEEEYYYVVEPRLRAIAAPTCSIAASDDAYFDASTPAPGQGADGILIKAYIRSGTEESFSYRQCAFAAIASTDAAKTLTGKVTLNGTTLVESPEVERTVLPPATSTLSGDVFVTAPISVSDDTYIEDPAFTANGNATRTYSVKTTTKVSDKKTKSEKKRAKSTFEKRNKAAKKAYKKALDKAGKSKSKKAAAKKAYSKKKASYKAKYRYAVASYKLVTRTVVKTENTPFDLSAGLIYEEER